MEMPLLQENIKKKKKKEKNTYEGKKNANFV